MVGRTAVILGLGLGLGLGLSQGAAKKVASAGHSLAIHLRALDLKKREAVVEVTGVSRVPAANLFTFTDARERHFVAMSVRCDEAQAEARLCRLEIPAGYEKHELVSLGLHAHSLKGRVIEVPREEVQDAWRAAQTSPVD